MDFFSDALSLYLYVSALTRPVTFCTPNRGIS